MSVDFSWQVEDEEKRETPPLSPKRQQRISWRRVAGIALLVLFAATGIAAGIVWQRAHQGKTRLRHDLEVVANMETQAVRDGDFDTLRSLQDREDASPNWWPVLDKEPGWEANLTVVEIGLISGNRAWAEVAWAMDDGIYRRAQFYRYVKDQWLRTGLRREYFGEKRTRETEHFFLKYLSRDEPTARWMAGQLETWYDALCADLGCNDGPRINIEIITAGQVGRLQPPEGFIVRSPRLRGVREDGALLPEERRELARILALLLVARRAGDIHPVQQPYLLPQFANWELRRLGLAGEETPPTPVLDYVRASHGPKGMHALLAAMGQTTSDTQALSQALGIDVVDLDALFDRYLAALLAVERQVMTWETTEPVAVTYHSLAEQTFNRLLAPTITGEWRNSEWWQQKMTAFDVWRRYISGDRTLVTIPFAPLNHPGVHLVELYDDRACAKVVYSGTMLHDDTRINLHRIESFQRVVDTWRHAPPDEQCLGEGATLISEHFRIECHEQEISSIASQVAQLEARFETVSRDLQVSLPKGERLTIRLVAHAQPGYKRADSVVEVTSPLVTGLGDDWSMVNKSMIFEQLAMQKTGDSRFVFGPGESSLWLSAIVNWYRAFSEDQPDPFLRPWADNLRTAIEADQLIPLSELWEDYYRNHYRPGGGENLNLAQGEAAAVVQYVMEAHGPEMLPTVVETLHEADFTINWLELALDVNLETFEAEWQAWLREQVLITG